MIRDFKNGVGRLVAHASFTLLHFTSGWWKIIRPAPQPRRAIIVTPGEGGSLGDEAMLQGLKLLLVEAKFEQITILSLSGEVPGEYLNGVPPQVKIRGVVFKSAVYRFLRFMWLASSHSHCFVIGADVMDCFYSERVSRERFRIASLASGSGLATTVTGFSVRSDLPVSCAAMMRRLGPNMRLCARDATSLERLAQHSGHAGELVADLAFLLPAEETTLPVIKARAWCAAEQAAGRTVLGVNANFHILGQIADDPAGCVRIYSALLYELAAHLPRLSFLLIPHDLRISRDSVSDLWLCREIAAALRPEQRERCMVVEDCHQAGEVKGLVAGVDAVFTARMHLAVAALGRGVPAFGLAYQGKFEGLYRHFELDGSQIAPGELMHTAQAARWLLALIARREALRAKIAAKLPHVVALARRNVPEAGIA